MPSRREMIQLSDTEIAEFMETSKTVILVSNGRDGYPHPMPMWFYFEPPGSAAAAGALYCTTFARSQKVANLERDPRATLLVESGEEYAELKGVVVYARAAVLADRDAVVDTLVKIHTKGRDVAPAEVEALVGAVSGTAAKRVVLKFTAERYLSWDHAKLGGRY